MLLSYLPTRKEWGGKWRVSEANSEKQFDQTEKGEKGLFLVVSEAAHLKPSLADAARREMADAVDQDKGEVER